VRVNERSRPSLQVATTSPADGLAQTDYRDAGGLLRVRALRIERLGHAWTGAPGGHPFVEAEGVALTRLVLQFLRDVRRLAA
jgi:poly(3-hydroxybutyrate) depolymerase